MKWALTSPDGLGDFLLRMPWLLAMQEAGWQLTLLARQPTIELAALTGLRANLVPLRRSPYSKETRRLADPFRPERHAAEGCDLVFFGPAQPSFFEEELARTLREPRLAGFVLEEDFWPSESVADPVEISGRFSIRVGVKNSDPEPVRNQRAASTLLGREVPCSPWGFSESAVATWAKPGLPAGPYTVVCAGYREGDYYGGMGTDRWIEELRRIEPETTLVFTGSAAEAGSHAAILSHLSKPERHVDLTGKLKKLEELLAVLNGAEMYLGKDSGTMHLAAALQKPVVAIFGGGHWGRFFPTGTRAVVLSTRVPCRHCDWRCHLPEPVCATGLPAGSLSEARETLLADNKIDVIVREFDPGNEHLKMIRATDATGFPARIHRERKARLLAEIQSVRCSLTQRILSRLRGAPR